MYRRVQADKTNSTQSMGISSAITPASLEARIPMVQAAIDQRAGLDYEVRAGLTALAALEAIEKIC